MIKKTGEILGIIVSSSAIVLSIGTVFYKAYGKELIKPDVEEINKPLERRLRRVEKVVGETVFLVQKESIKTGANFELLIKDNEFFKEYMYQQNPKLYRNVKRKIKEKRE